MSIFVPSICIGLFGNRQTGKDTLGGLLRKINPSVRTYSFASALRGDLGEFIHQHYGIDIWTTNPKEKELIRPFLIAHGCGMRELDPLHWVKRVAKDIDSTGRGDPNIIPVITDVRFCNEAQFFKELYGDHFKLVHVNRLEAPKPTHEEEINAPEVIPLVDFGLHWGKDTPEEQLARAREVARRVGMEEKQ